MQQHMNPGGHAWALSRVQMMEQEAMSMRSQLMLGETKEGRKEGGRRKKSDSIIVSFSISPFLI